MARSWRNGSRSGKPFQDYPTATWRSTGRFAA
jgi:hypothetical protein